MVNEQFNSVTELYMRVLPALQVKRKEFIVNKLNFITEKDIWDCLNELVWSKNTDLTLFDIVNSILTLKEEVILDFLSEDLK